MIPFAGNLVPWLVCGAVLSAACATPRAPSADCRRWIRDPHEGAPSGDFLVAVGTTDASRADATEAARTNGLRGLAEQLRVDVDSRSLDETVLTTAGGTEHVDRTMRDRVETRSSLRLEGAAVLDTCRDGDRLHVLMGLDRRRFLASLARRAAAIEQEVASLESLAGRHSAEGRHLEAAVRYREAAGRLADRVEIDSLSTLLGGGPTGEVRRTVGELEQQSREEMARSRVQVRVEHPLDAGFGDLAVACLGRMGLAATRDAGPSEAVVLLELAADAPLVTGRLHLVRAQLTATLRRGATGTTTSGASTTAKGSGLSPEAATQDAVRRLGRDRLSTTFAELFSAAGLALPTCDDGG